MGANSQGSLVTVANDECVELGEDEYWTDDIVGLKDPRWRKSAKSKRCCDGSDDTSYGAKVGSALPAFADVILDVDLDSGTMKVRIPEGLADR